eukprot:3189368-Rhodomonas_salina.2
MVRAFLSIATLVPSLDPTPLCTDELDVWINFCTSVHRIDSRPSHVCPLPSSKTNAAPASVSEFPRDPKATSSPGAPTTSVRDETATDHPKYSECDDVDETSVCLYPQLFSNPGPPCPEWMV